MSFEHPERLLVLATAMMLFGCIMPFLMVLEIVESTYFMNFLSAGLSTLGLFLGIAATAMLRVKQRNKKNDEDQYRR
ncbi:MAG: hypothetical protein JNK32_10685 [Anaerolineales bacterium]|nr:hypothetical protein [Anaerolineales bacterium]